MKIIVTGGAGFIGSAVVRHLIAETDHEVHCVDKLTYASSLDAISEAAGSELYSFSKIDICDGAALVTLFQSWQPDAVIHLAAETHVDRSIDSPTVFIETNVMGTATLLEAARTYWQNLPNSQRENFRFHHVSTDEVFGDLEGAEISAEGAAYNPSSPYAASKAGADHLVRAWHRTYGLPVLLSNGSNNFGLYQFPEKLIPLMIIKALSNEPLPVYGDGSNVRDWIHVEDHAEALINVLQKGRVGETYNIGGGSNLKNINIVEKICDELDNIVPSKEIESRRKLITFVADRPGHDQRYAIDSSKIQNELGWHPRLGLDDGLRQTVQWYVNNRHWWEPIMAERNPSGRQGLGRGK
ncbi:MAG: dTDP-glucose 4,6-dehydratase [Rhodospirillales bacterium]|nr:dTDP-glucose 4,6-dehydratase [Rhodospirillaceae bacterium]MBT8004365.1 dTDP-glucose 4,6-dehydratase [Rhodospirillales bacterium]